MPDHAVIPPFADSRLPHVGTYRRVLPVSLVRLYENALDWEHLPHLHRSSFSDIECLEAGAWGWRARTIDARDETSVIELRLDRACRRWITRTLSGRNAGAEIWTHAFPMDDARVDIVVDFFVPDVAPEAREKVGRAFAALYEQLYDEDVAMMVERQQRLDQRMARPQDAPSEVVLGPKETLALPMDVSLGGRTFVLSEVDGTLVLYPALCPHQLGPLSRAPLIDGVVTCPWHGYRFDVRTGDCLSGQTCRLGEVPGVEDRDGRVVISERR